MELRPTCFDDELGSGLCSSDAVTIPCGTIRCIASSAAISQRTSIGSARTRLSLEGSPEATPNVIRDTSGKTASDPPFSIPVEDLVEPKLRGSVYDTTMNDRIS